MKMVVVVEKKEDDGGGSKGGGEKTTNKKEQFFKRRILCINGHHGERDTMNTTHFSPRMTRSKSKRLQKQQQKTNDEVIISDCSAKEKQLGTNGEEESRKTNKVQGTKAKGKKKIKKSTGEMNSVLANRGSVGSISLLQTPKRCENMALLKTGALANFLTPKNPDLVSSPAGKGFRLKSPKIGTISADTPQRTEHFYRNIENITDCRLRILGKGSFGTVIQATYKGELVAAKIVPPNKRNTLKNELNNFFLSHPNIVKTLRIISNEENPSYGLVIMEMCSSVTLENLAHEDSYNLNDDSITRYMVEIGRALEYCHSQRVLHLDVKPKNILVNITTNVCKLCDFGSSCLLMGEDGFIEPAGYETLQNTAVYTCPELLTGGSPTEKSDVYSFGITLWQLVNREKPYVVDNKIDLQSTIYKIVKQKKRPQKKGKSNEAMENLYIKCWDHDPDKRPTMKEIVQYLENIPQS